MDMLKIQHENFNKDRFQYKIFYCVLYLYVSNIMKYYIML